MPNMETEISLNFCPSDMA